MVARDISWLYFNHRILLEGRRRDVPLLERVAFLGIYSNNLDEFFRVRYATLSHIARLKGAETRREAHEALGTLREVNALNARYSEEFQQALSEVRADLSAAGIEMVDERSITEGQRHYLRRLFRDSIAGYVNPQWLDRVGEFSHENDDHIYLGVRMTDSLHPGRKGRAVIELPVERCGRFVTLPGVEGDPRRYVIYLDDVVRLCLPMIFPGLGYDCFEAYSFKFTKDAEMELDDDARLGKLQLVARGVKSRRRGDTLRVVFDAGMPDGLRHRIMQKLKLDKLDTVLATGRYHNHKDLMSFPSDGRPDLRYGRWTPVVMPALKSHRSLIDQIRGGDLTAHVPYQSFDIFIRLLQEASVNPNVKSVKITLYRLARESRVAEALMAAARNGRKVTVVIELMARFDEASNIAWAKRMQDAGVNVIFGVEGLKVHSKIVHIGMRHGPDIAVVSTGNFHEGNARAYTDFLLFTADRRITSDVASVFSFIRQPFAPVRYSHLLVSPNHMEDGFIRMIEEEIAEARAGRPARIRIKINHITDPAMVAALYAAAEAGVRVDLLVRGNCSLTAARSRSVGGNMRVIGIIDRYLEHSRIFIFGTGTRARYFIGSADWMPRNLHSRIEVVTPVYSEEARAELARIVDWGLEDCLQGRVVDGSGSNLTQCADDQEMTPEARRETRSQERLHRWYTHGEE